MSDIDDLIGGTPQDDTPQDEIDALCREVATGKGSFVNQGDLKRPVTMNFLALVFDMDPATVKKRLLAVKPVGYGGTAKQPRPLYDFKEACAYLVEPKIDLDAYIRSIDVNKLPNLLNKMYWEGKRTRLKYLQEAGDAWRTEDVLERFGTVFMLIKDHTQLWSEKMREEIGLTDEQYRRFKQMQDALLGDLDEQLKELPAQSRTPSIAVVEGDAEGESADA
jgi:hypothetical protein